MKFTVEVDDFYMDEEGELSPALSKDAEIAALRTDIMRYEDKLLEENGRVATLTRRVKELEAANAKYREALEKIRSGIGKDILGITSLVREDMQDIAREALKEPLPDRLRGRTKITDEDVLAAPNDSSTCPGGVSPNCESVEIAREAIKED